MTTKSAVTSAVVAAVKEAAASPKTHLDPKDVPAVAKAVSESVAPIVAHTTNNEPWYQSRVTWGAIGAIILPLAGALGVSADIISADEFVALGIAAGTVASGLLTLYGRYIARTPIGSGK